MDGARSTAGVRLLLWLRYRTMFRAGGGKARLIGALIGFAFLVPISILCGFFVHGMTAAFVAGGDAAALALWIDVVFLAGFAMLVILPVIGLAGSEFFDISKLFHLPVSHRTVLIAQVIGMMAGGVVLFFTPALVGLVIGLPGGPLHVALRLLLLVSFLFFTVALSRMLQLVLLNLLRSRRFRDLAAILGALVSASVFLAFRRFSDTTDGQGEVMGLVSRLADAGAGTYIAAVPSSWVAGVVSPEAGTSAVLLFALGFLPLTGLFVLVAAALQERAFHGEVPISTPRVRTAATRAGEAGRSGFEWIPEDVRAVASKEIRLLRREPLVKTLLIQQSVFLLVPVAMAIYGSGSGAAGIGRGVVEWGVYALLFVESLLSMNLLGLEGPGLVCLLKSPAPRRRILAGQNLAYGLLWGTVNVAFVTVAVSALALVGGGIPVDRLPGVFAAAIAGVLLMQGAGSVTSVLGPQRLTSGGRRALAQQSGGGCMAAIVRMVGWLVLVVLLVPVYFLSLVPWLAPVTLGYGALFCWLGNRVGASLLAGREDELLLLLARSPE